MKRFLSVAVLGLLTLIRWGSAQDAPAPSAQVAEKSDIFSGVVVELSSDSVTVMRKAMGTEAATKKFSLDSQTRVEGKLQLKSRVTVRFEMDSQVTVHALHIIVR